MKTEDGVERDVRSVDFAYGVIAIDPDTVDLVYVHEQEQPLCLEMQHARVGNIRSVDMQQIMAQILDIHSLDLQFINHLIAKGLDLANVVSQRLYPLDLQHIKSEQSHTVDRAKIRTDHWDKHSVKINKSGYIELHPRDHLLKHGKRKTVKGWEKE